VSATCWTAFGFAFGFAACWLMAAQARADHRDDLARVRRQLDGARADNLRLMQRLNRAEFTVEAIDDARRRQGMASHPAGGCDEDTAAFWQIIEDAL